MCLLVITASWSGFCYGTAKPMAGHSPNLWGNTHVTWPWHNVWESFITVNYSFQHGQMSTQISEPIQFQTMSNLDKSQHMVVSTNHPFLIGISHDKPSNFWYPMETPRSPLMTNRVSITLPRALAPPFLLEASWSSWVEASKRMDMNPVRFTSYNPLFRVFWALKSVYLPYVHM